MSGVSTRCRGSCHASLRRLPGPFACDASCASIGEPTDHVPFLSLEPCSEAAVPPGPLLDLRGHQPLPVFSRPRCKTFPSSHRTTPGDRLRGLLIPAVLRAQNRGELGHGLAVRRTHLAADHVQLLTFRPDHLAHGSDVRVVGVHGLKHSERRSGPRAHAVVV